METFTRYDDGPEDYADIPVSTTQSSQDQRRIRLPRQHHPPHRPHRLPAPTHEAAKANAVQQRNPICSPTSWREALCGGALTAKDLAGMFGG
jgi:hypothetical protein